MLDLGGVTPGLNVDTAFGIACALLASPVFAALAVAIAYATGALKAHAFMLYMLITGMAIAARYRAPAIGRKIDWSQHTILLTGGCHGIGLGLLHKLAAAAPGNAKRIAVVDILDLPEGAPLGVGLYRCNLADIEQLKPIVDQITADMGPVTMLINNAGTVCSKVLSEQSFQDMHRVVGVNMLAPMELTRLLLPGMLASPDAHIVFVSSVLGFIGIPELTTYTATKAALAIFSESLKLELVARQGARHVRTTAVFPSQVNSGMFSGVRIPQWLAPNMSPDAVAARIFQCLESASGSDIYLPLYANLGPVYMILPRAGRSIVHWIGSSLDAMRTYRGHSLYQNKTSAA
ncbi:hypothetical protein LPJ66_010118 [Kickxella alabastrina]|uniref:Uncharacterized protein n=1 Tax=Kickxella alabastrina TaxID=61397 RepID=A0ACC1I1Y8_9FUNG|nr:hypothetical protein LPJ66_010118 [Kickxella alabastrina]